MQVTTGNVQFIGGAFGDEDYIWMKDYLQVEGVCYKLIPIKTPIDPERPYEMGRVNTKIMYPLVKSWVWGKRDDQDIYYDVGLAVGYCQAIDRADISHKIYNNFMEGK